MVNLERIGIATHTGNVPQIGRLAASWRSIPAWVNGRAVRVVLAAPRCADIDSHPLSTAWPTFRNRIVVLGTLTANIPSHFGAQVRLRLERSSSSCDAAGLSMGHPCGKIGETPIAREPLDHELPFLICTRLFPRRPVLPTRKSTHSLGSAYLSTIHRFLLQPSGG
jgi:hypothetical protein